MARFQLQAVESAEVNLGTDDEPVLFETARLTRGLKKKVNAVIEKAEATDDPDKEVELIASVLDLMLKGNGKAKPSTVIVKRWKADEVTSEEVLDLYVRIKQHAYPT